METLCPSSNSSWVIEHGQSTPWTKEENKRFESALAVFDDRTPNRWFHVAAMIPGKSVYDVMNQYRELVADVSDIEAGLVPLPGYMSPLTVELAEAKDNRARCFYAYRKQGRTHNSDQERKKGVPWTEEEHRRFLLGLKKHGKGDWRNISRNFVISKTSTQVASHAQKYYLRQLSGSKDKRRPSIHDITTVDLTSADTRETRNKETIKVNNNTTHHHHHHHQNDSNGANSMAFGSDLAVHPNSDILSRYMVNNIGAGFRLQSAPGIRF